MTDGDRDPNPVTSTDREPVISDSRQIRTVFFCKTAGGPCKVCGASEGVHEATCPIVALDAQVKELAAHTGIYVAAVQDTLETIGRILRDDRA